MLIPLALLLMTWTAAAGKVDVDGDGIPDRIRIESRDAERFRDADICGACGKHVDGHFEAVVELSRDRRTVRTPISIHSPGESLWFWDRPTSGLAIADYNGDGRPDFNLGQYTNTIKWEYALFTIHPDGRAEIFALHQPEIYVAPGDTPSTEGIQAIPGGMRFRDYGNAGDAGWWTFTCLWQQDRQAFQCTSERD